MEASPTRRSTRSRRSNSSTKRPIPAKRRRSSRRLSLAEVQKYVSDKTQPQEDIEEENDNKVLPEQNKSVKLTLPEKNEDEVPMSAEMEFTFSQIQKLRNESKRWDELLQKFEQQESEIKSMSLEQNKMEDTATTKYEPQGLNVQEVAHSLENLEQRFTRSLQVITQCMRTANAVKERQETALKIFIQKQTNEIYEKHRATDPREIIHEIFRLDKITKQHDKVELSATEV